MGIDSYYSPEGDIAYLHVRTSGRVRSEELDWGLRDYDAQSGELVGLEVWDASKVLPAELVESLPQTEGRSDAVVTREDPTAAVEQARFGATRCEIYKDQRGEYRWRLVASNGLTVADSGEGYATSSIARRAAESTLAEHQTA